MGLLNNKPRGIKTEMCQVIPDTRIYGRLGQVGYLLNDAISELVDNSIDARRTNKKLTVNIKFDNCDNSITVVDNGKGMSKKEAITAITLAKSDKKNQLGFFGLGMKTAGMAMGDILTIKTKKESSDKLYSAILDRKDFEQRNDWEIPLDVEIDPIQETGTTIVIEEVKKMPTGISINNLRKNFSKRYSSFIESGDVEILINGRNCSPLKKDYIMETPIDLTTKTGHKITGVLRLQTERFQKKLEYGFDLFKNGRIITSYDKIGFEGVHGEKALICGELNLDFCPVNFSKNRFLESTEEYRAVALAIKDYLKPLMPSFTTKYLQKDKIEKILKKQKESGKSNLPNLEEFNSLLANLANEKNSEEELMTNDSSSKLIEKIAESSEEETVASLPKHAILSTHIGEGAAYLDKINRILKELAENKEHFVKFKNDSGSKLQLEVFAGTLKDSAELADSILEMD
jgi:hypothetical protein